MSHADQCNNPEPKSHDQQATAHRLGPARSRGIKRQGPARVDASAGPCLTSHSTQSDQANKGSISRNRSRSPRLCPSCRG